MTAMICLPLRVDVLHSSLDCEKSEAKHDLISHLLSHYHTKS